MFTLDAKHWNQATVYHSLPPLPTVQCTGMDVSRDSEKRDMKKMIPRLRLDRLPNYHLKNQKTAQPPVPGLNLNAASLSSTNPNLSSNSSTNKQATLLQHTIGHSHYNFSGSSALGYSHATLNSSSLQKLMSQK